MSTLPPELILDILLRLPPKDLIRSLCVSKACDNNTSGTAVKAEKPFKFPDAYDVLRLSGHSVHGLFCIHSKDGRYIALWNPSIQKLKKIPLPTFGPSYSEWFSKRKRNHLYGLGYDSVNDDYKLVGMVVDDRSVQVQIYSLKSNSWKRIQNGPLFSNISLGRPRIMFCNGAMSWLIVNNEVDGNRYIIQTLNLATIIRTVSLEVLGGCLCLCVYVPTGHAVWIMKEYGVTESWTLLYCLENEAVPSGVGYFSKPLVLSKNGEMVLTHNGRGFFWYDLRNKSFKQVQFSRPPSTQLDITFYVGSLCLLDGDPVIAERGTSRWDLMLSKIDLAT
ncbi:hypothetical protein PRUPE_1G024400 [Prunus persica]|uniref:F-box domain-containing protein n=1 Tax=Prunus persica TaxID=3760 RepID=A0A251QRS5_PRUPE|nr:hypothetical protein PRUPE_1G024400 [Prunus persica]